MDIAGEWTDELDRICDRLVEEAKEACPAVADAASALATAAFTVLAENMGPRRACAALQEIASAATQRFSN